MISVFVVSVLLFAHHGAAQSNYITYRPGSCRIILTSAHGGYLEPSSVPDRDAGCRIRGDCVYSHTCGRKDSQRCNSITTRDGYMKELTELLEEALIARGCRPHVIINELARSKLDSNREIGEAAYDVSSMEWAFNLYTYYIEAAKMAVGLGVLFDLHGVQSHSENWIEVGYRVSKTDLNSGSFSPGETSIRALGERVCGSSANCFDHLLRGEGSFGQMLADQNPGPRVIPSVETPRPGSGGYFRGGYTTETHGSIDAGQVDAIQIETPARLRGADTAPQYAEDLAQAMVSFYTSYYHYD